MNIHQNARTNPYSRALLVARIEGGWTAAAAAASFGISVRTVRKWRARERAEGAAGLVDRSSRPLRPAGRMGAGWRKMILRLRHCRLTAAEIASRLGLARSTVAAELARLGLGQLAALEPKAPIRRYERRRPGDLVHLDIKKFARFDKPGHRVTGSRRRPEQQGRLRICPRLHRRPFQGRLCRGPGRRDRRHLRPLPRPGRGLVRQPGHHRAPGHDRQRRRLSQPPLPPRLAGPGPAPPADPPLHAQNQRQGGTVHQDHAPGLGLCRSRTVLPTAATASCRGG